MQLLSELHQNGRTVVVVTHDPRMTRFATEVLYILDGRLVTREAYELSSAIPPSTDSSDLLTSSIISTQPAAPTSGPAAP